MTADVIPIGTLVNGNIDLPPERVLTGAISAKLTHVVVIGVDEDGNDHFAASCGELDTLWMMESAKMRLLKMGNNE